MHAVPAAECASPCRVERGCPHRNEDCRCDIALNRTDIALQAVGMLRSMLASILADRKARLSKRSPRSSTSHTREPRLHSRASLPRFRAQRQRKILCTAFQPLPLRHPTTVRIHRSEPASKVDPFPAGQTRAAGSVSAPACLRSSVLHSRIDRKPPGTRSSTRSLSCSISASNLAYIACNSLGR
jgi:hypothetical protein